MHKGFPLYDLMTPLMPNLAKGNNVYRPSQGTYGAASTSLQQLPLPGSNPNDDSANPNEETGVPVDRREFLLTMPMGLHHLLHLRCHRPESLLHRLLLPLLRAQILPVRALHHLPLQVRSENSPH